MNSTGLFETEDEFSLTPEELDERLHDGEEGVKHVLVGARKNL